MLRNCWAFVLAGVTLAAAQSPEQSILSYKQYAAIEHKSPYVLQFKAGPGALLFYGAEHTAILTIRRLPTFSGGGPRSTPMSLTTRVGIRRPCAICVRRCRSTPSRVYCDSWPGGTKFQWRRSSLPSTRKFPMF